MFHLVTWTKELGGAGIMPGHGRFQNVKAVFPLHNRKVNNNLLLEFSRKATLSVDDLDRIRAIYGEKVCDRCLVLYGSKSSTGCVLLLLSSDLYDRLDLPVDNRNHRVGILQRVLICLRRCDNCVVYCVSRVLEGT